MSDVENLEEIGHAMMLAWGRIKKSQARMWGDWMTIGEGLLEGRRWAMRQAGLRPGANRPEGKGYVMAFAEWLKRFKVDDMDKSDRAKLLQLMEERAAVEEWRATLTDYERRNINNPTIAWRKWTAATRVKKPKPRTAGVSASEHGRAQATVEQLQDRVEELEQESHEAWVAALKDRPYEERAEALYQLMLEFDLSLSHLDDVHEAFKAGQEDAEPEQGLRWTGDDDEGYLGCGLIDGHPIAYVVMPVKFKGLDAFEAKILADFKAGFKPDLKLPVWELATHYGVSLTGNDRKGQRRNLDPVPDAEQAKELCEIAYGQQ